MGVRGLTTFIAHRSREYLERFELHDSYLVIDGNSIACQIYLWHCNRCNDCFGGDYDTYSKEVYKFFELLKTCNITPFLVFDGAYEKRKMKTVYSRIQNKFSAGKALNSVTEGSVTMFPLFMREVFVDVVLQLKLQSVRCEFESDGDAAQLAKALNCPLLSYDSDFYIFDVLYLPFSNFELKCKRGKNYNYIDCDIYRVEKFLRAFGGLSKDHLPLLAVLLGNDYIKKKTFAAFYRQLKIHKTKENEQQTLIKSVIMWLKEETVESALRKILGRFKIRQRRKLAKKIEIAIESYQNVDSSIYQHFNIDKNQPDRKIVIPNPEEIEDLEDLVEEEESDSDEDCKAEDSKFPNFFLKNFKNCLYPSCFMDMLTMGMYFCIPQIDDYSVEHSHAISLELISTIHKILTFPRRKKLICVSRGRGLNVEKTQIRPSKVRVPTLPEIENLDSEAAKMKLLEILNVGFLPQFPSSWHIFILSMKYWVVKSDIKIDLSYIYSTVLCAIVLNFVDEKIGVWRLSRHFKLRFGQDPKPGNPSTANNILQALKEIDLCNSVSCMDKLIPYFQMDEKMKSYAKLYDRTIVHHLAQFQSCLLHIKYLNSLLNFPFDSFIISKFFDGTFIYNLTANFQKRTDLKSYVKILLEKSPMVLNALELIVDQLEKESGCILEHKAPKKRRRKRKIEKSEVVEVDMDVAISEDEDFVFDANNKFSLLSVVNYR